MINLFEISINVLENIILYSFLTFYLGGKYHGIKKIAGVCVGVLVAVIAITYLNSLYIYEGILGMFFVFVYLIYSLIFLKGNIYMKVFMAAFTNCFVYFLALFTSLCAGLIFDKALLYSMTLERIALISTNKILIILVCLILLKFKINHNVKKSNLLILTFISIATYLSMVGLMNIFLKYDNLNSELILASISVMMVNVLIYYLYIKLNKEIKVESEMKTLQQKYEFDKEHAQEVKELYTKACSIRHDIINHFVTLNVLIDDNQKAKEYIQSIIGNKLNNTRFFIETGNINFDAIVNAKIALCEKQGIKTYVKTDGSIDILSPDETAVLFGNLFDNAIEASSQTSEKRIELEIGQQDEYISILMKNCIDKSVLDGNEKLKTTKKEKEFHGYGIKNIKKVVSKHKGLISFDEEKGYFICHILLQK